MNGEVVPVSSRPAWLDATSQEKALAYRMLRFAA
jgi:hypothetical protein